MKFTATVIAALAAVASAIPAFTNSDFDLQEGKPITLTWSGATGPVNIQVLSGPNKDSLVPVVTIGCMFMAADVMILVVKLTNSL